MKRSAIVMAVLVCVAAAQTAKADPHRIGGGIHYNVSANTIAEEFDVNGLSYLISYQYVPETLPLKFEGDVEFMPDDVTGNGTAIVPQAHILLGGMIYAGLGIGLPYMDGSFGDPMYNLRLGLDIGLSRLHLDLNANYQFADFSNLGNIDTDLITIGLIARIEF